MKSSRKAETGEHGCSLRAICRPGTANNWCRRGAPAGGGVGAFARAWRGVVCWLGLSWIGMALASGTLIAQTPAGPALSPSTAPSAPPGIDLTIRPAPAQALGKNELAQKPRANPVLRLSPGEPSASSDHLPMNAPSGPLTLGAASAAAPVSTPHQTTGDQPGVASQSVAAQPFPPVHATAPPGAGGGMLTVDADPPADDLSAKDRGWTIQVRAAWGGGEEQTWQAEFSWSAGPIVLIRALGIEADEPGSMWTEDGVLHVRQPSARAYDGVDMRMPFDAEGVLRYRFTTKTGETINGQVTVAELLGNTWQKPLDESGNRLFLRRMPGDALRVHCERGHLVCDVGEEFRFEVTPHLLPVADGAGLRIRPKLVLKSSGQEVGAQEYQIHKYTRNWSRPAAAGGAQPSIPFTLRIPEQEGVYEIQIEVTEKGPLRWGKPLMSRTVQLVAVAELSSRPSTGKQQNPWVKVQEIDPTNNSWTEKFRGNWSFWPGSRPGSLGNGKSQVIEVAGWGNYLQLNNNDPAGETAWEAYPLTIAQPGMPHILEVEYPTQLAQRLGISLVEPNAAGQVQPIGLDSGVLVTPEGVTSQPGWGRQRVVFWPRTKTPVLLLTNRGAAGVAAYGKIQVLAGPAHLPAAGSAANFGERLWGAGWLRPLFPENFSAAEALDPWSGRTLDDWQTFWEGSQRMLEYLRHHGHNTLVLAAYADGSAIFPASGLGATPRYDTGVFFDAGQDLERKDVLELLCRLCDREQVQLFAGLQFAATIPALERQLREDPVAAVGISLVGAEGRPWTAVHPARRGLAPYYNPLDPRVQDVIRRTVRATARRYAPHPSFRGLVLEVSADGFLQFPGEYWGLDDRTVAEFEQSAQLQIPASGPERHWQRARYLQANPAARQAWLNFRAERLSDFFARLTADVRDARGDLQLVFLPTNPWESPDLPAARQPTLVGARSPRDWTLPIGGQGWGAAGTDGDLRDAGPSSPRAVITVSPESRERTASAAPLWLHTARQFASTELLTGDSEREFLAELRRPEESPRGSAPNLADMVAGTVFLHEPQRLRLASFDEKSPFGKEKTFTWQVTQFSPAAWGNRRRFALALAERDQPWLIDAGWLLPLGQEEHLQEMGAAFRRLPAETFGTLDMASEPVTLRWLVLNGQTWLYAVNSAPFAVKVKLGINLPTGSRPVELSGMRVVAPVQGNTWTLELKPYDLLAVRWPGNVQIISAETQFPGELADTLQSRLGEMRARRATLENPPPLTTLLNGDLERPVDKNGASPHWQLSASEDAEAAAAPEMRVVFDNPQQGTQALLISNPLAQSATLQSEPLAAPISGRLALSVWLKIADPRAQPQVRLVISGLLRDEEFVRYAPIGAQQPAAPLRDSWAQYVLQVDDLPTQGLTQLRVRIELLGAGQLWVDNAQLFDLAFSEAERRQFDKLLALADFQLQNGKLGRCWTHLQGYWSRYLHEVVPPPKMEVFPAAKSDQPQNTTPPPESTPTKTGEQAAKPTMWDRMRDWWR
ncbi:MAG: hypothetical protein SFX18_07270 [Pirellulales bacterium]|nr:hypothetical protein [Pirellulales bacterium]